MIWIAAIISLAVGFVIGWMAGLMKSVNDEIKSIKEDCDGFHQEPWQ